MNFLYKIKFMKIKFSSIIFGLTILIIIISTNYSYADHYKNLKKIEMNVYRNGEIIGFSNYEFINNGNILEVLNTTEFKVIVLGVKLFSIKSASKEIYENDQLIEFNSKTLQNKKSKFVNLDLIDNEFLIDGSSFKGKVPKDYILGTWWNHSIVEAKAQISAVSGRIIEQNVTFLGKETLEINGNQYKTLHFNFSSSDPKLKKDKKLNTDVWYDEKTLSWVKASFNKKGYWEYKLVSMK